MNLGLFGASCGTMVVFFESMCFLGFSCFLPHTDIYTCNGAVNFSQALQAGSPGLRVLVSVDRYK